MQRFYLPQTNFDHQLTISKEKYPDLFHQLKNVLRAEIGDQFIFFSGKDTNESVLELTESGKEFYFTAKETRETKTELPNSLTLIQAVPQKSEKWEWILQKGTELGVSTFIPLITERTQRKILPKVERMEKILIEAVEQSGRVKIPTITTPLALEKLTLPANTHSFFASLHGTQSLQDHIKTKHPRFESISIIIGPEGGLSPKEEDFLIGTGALPFSLGTRALRLETAALASLAIISSSI
ncbi:MAG TPA: RsmE family RNA methyltransferase [Nitrosopumilaceae archaeon]|uniref:Ribosomal RNA small subunit methyltransferase E n=1 Tax=Candidatus Abawacabacteria bacterium RBG_16_42_10 TaxID=1817814 RepID=A0A1F4XL75_9BACT|nr:MAG: hypothetical protein A2V81_02260 [Candidatus Abawacabacteria bacterium RBG_16_42_10]HLA22388.1 RsmE family RNA methyltransferase [Nitrosopumilaceae archaeon]